MHNYVDELIRAPLT